MIKRPLLLVVLLFVMGLFFAAYDVNILITAFVCLAVCLLIYYRTKQQLYSVIAVLLILLGVVRFEVFEFYTDKVVSRYVGKTETMRLTVSDFSDKNTVKAYFKDDGKKYKVHLIINEFTELSPGDIIEGEITLKSPVSSKISRFGTEKSLAGSGIFLSAKAESVTKITEKEKGIIGILHAFRNYTDNLGKGFFSNDDRALFNAMIFGDKRLVSDKLYSALQSSGLNHIAVVSGMHFSVAIAFLLFISRKFLGNSRRSFVPVLIFSFFLTVLTGGGASVIRAFMMSCIFILSKVLFRHEDSLTSLGITVFVMTAVNPFIIFNVGFIMSVLSVLGILLFHRRTFGFLKKFIPEKLSSVLSLSISAQMAVIPISVHFFGTVAPYSLLSNALLVPFAGIYVIMGMLFIILSPLPFAAELISLVMRIISGFITRVCFAIGNFPFSLTEIGVPLIIFSFIWIFLCVLVFAGTQRRRKKYLSAVFLPFVLALSIFSPTESINIDSVTYGKDIMTAVSVKEGGSLLVDCPDIYDASLIENPKSPFLFAVLTTANPGELFKKESNIKTVFVPDGIFDNFEKPEFVKKAEKKQIRVVFAEDLKKYQAGNTIVEFLPVENENSARAVKIQHKNKTIISFQGCNSYTEEKVNADFAADYIVLPALKMK